MQPATQQVANHGTRAVSILARSLFRHMRDQGYTTDQIISLSSELIQLVSTDLRATGDELADAAE